MVAVLAHTGYASGVLACPMMCFGSYMALPIMRMRPTFGNGLSAQPKSAEKPLMNFSTQSQL